MEKDCVQKVLRDNINGYKITRVEYQVDCIETVFGCTHTQIILETPSGGLYTASIHWNWELEKIIEDFINNSYTWVPLLK